MVVLYISWCSFEVVPTFSTGSSKVETASVFHHPTPTSFPPSSSSSSSSSPSSHHDFLHLLNTLTDVTLMLYSLCSPPSRSSLSVSLSAVIFFPLKSTEIKSHLMLGDRSARHKESRYRERRVLTYMINQESKQRSEEDVMCVSVWA